MVSGKEAHRVEAPSDVTASGLHAAAAIYPVVLTSATWLTLWVPGGSTGPYFFLLTFCIPFFGSKSSRVAHTQGAGELGIKPLLWRGEDQCKIPGILCGSFVSSVSLPHSSFIYISMESWAFILYVGL